MPMAGCCIALVRQALRGRTDQILVGELGASRLLEMDRRE